MPGKVGRPRMPARKLSRWGVYKRGQRELPKASGAVRHHKRKGTYGLLTRGNSTLLSRSQHAKLHQSKGGRFSAR